MSEIIITCGIPAAGKTTLAQDYLKQGYVRLNRDQLGGKLIGIAQRLAKELEISNNRSFILDNTYPTKATRAQVVEVAKRFGLPIRCFWVNTSLEVAQFNAAHRMVLRYGKLLTPEEIKDKGKADPNCFPPGILYQYRKTFEPPTLEEGFSSVEEFEYVREWGPEYQNKALILDFDGTLRDTKSGNKYPLDPWDIQILPRRVEKLQLYKDQGYLILGVSNQSGIAKGIISLQTAQAAFLETNRQLGGLIQDFRFCPHQSHPLICYCRKPSSGWAAELIEKYKLKPEQCVMVGDMESDKTFASRSGFQYSEAETFFA